MEYMRILDVSGNVKKETRSVLTFRSRVQEVPQIRMPFSPAITNR